MKNRSVLTMLSIVVVLACFHTFALAQSDRDMATMSSRGSSVRWEMATPSQTTLTISTPDGRTFSKVFSAGTSPEFTLDQAEKLPDGNYTYELRGNPVLSADAIKALKAARGKDDDPESVRAARKRVDTGNQVQSGGFSIINGAAVVAGAVEGGDKVEVQPLKKPAVSSPTTNVTSAALTKIRQHHVAFSMMPDQVIPDDLIVQGSACVGLDCDNGEVFGFDTVRLKENNTRLQFDDTSAAGFPTNNWQIRANSSAAGGASFLGFVDQGAGGNSETGTIVFQVTAGAPANSLNVASNGKLGLRTATPALDVHANTSDTPAIRLEQNNSAGFAAQTWDIGANEANFFVRDVTGGSRLPFRVRPGALTSSIDIGANGNVGINNASPSGNLHTVGTFIFFDDSAAGISGGIYANALPGNAFTMWSGAGDFRIGTSVTNRTAGTGFAERIRILNSNGNVGIGTAVPDQKLSVNGDASKVGGGSWQVFSDERLKVIKGTYNSGLKALMRLQPIRYEYKPDNALNLKSEGEHVGFGAQAVQKVIPEAVTSTQSGYLMVNNDPIILTMLNAIKEQQQEIQQLKTELRKLQNSSRRRK